MAKKPDRHTRDASRQLAIEAARLASDRNGEDIVVLDLRKLSPITDYFVIATGTSSRQLRSLCDEIVKTAATDLGQKVFRIAGKETGDWIVMDFVDVVVHLFNRPLRRYYDLELIWGEAKRLKWQRSD